MNSKQHTIPYIINEKLPKQWIVIKLGFLVSAQKGKKPKHLVEEPRTNFLPYLNIESLEKNEISNYAKFDDGVQCSNKEIMLVWDGSRSGLPLKGMNGLVGSTLMMLNPIFIELNYLWVFLKSKYKYLNSVTKGIGIPHLDPKIIWNLEVPLPPLAEQIRISKKANQIFADTEKCISEINHAKRNIGLLQQSILQHSFSGKMTYNWRVNNKPKETGLELIKKIQEKSKNLKSSKKNFLKEDLISLPGNWEWTRIGDIFEVKVGGTPKRDEPKYWNGNIPWVSSGEVANHDITTTKEKISKLGLEESNAKIISPNDVLIAMIGQGKTRGQTAILKIKATTNQNIASIICSDTPIISEYVFYWLLSRYEETRIVGSGGMQKALNTDKIRELPIPIPPINEQQQIVKQIRELISKKTQIINHMNKSIEKFDEFYESSLNNILQGTSIKQNSKDKSAEEIIKKIEKDKHVVFNSKKINLN